MKKEIKILYILGIAGFVVTADNLVVSPILPAIAHSIKSTIPETGLIITAYMLPFGIFQILFGPLADRFGKIQTIIFSLIMFTFATGLCAFGKSLGNLIIFRGVTGIFAAAIIPISFALIGDLFPIEKRQGAIGTFLGISFLGQGFSMIIGSTLAYFFNWQWVFITYSMIALLPTVLLLTNYNLFPSEPRQPSQFYLPYQTLLGKKDNRCLYFIVFLEGFFILGSFSFIGSYIEQIYHFTNLVIGLIMTGFGLMTIVGGRLVGKMARCMKTSHILGLGLTIAAISDLIIFFNGNRLPFLVLGVAGLGLGFVLAHSTLLNRATQFSQTARGAAMSLVAFFFMSGGGIGTAVASQLIANFRLGFLFLDYGVALILTMFLSNYLIKE